MSKLTSSIRSWFLTGAVQLALKLGIAFIVFGTPLTSFAQAVVTPRQDVTLYRAFYYDDADKLIHVEIVRGAGDRSIQQLPKNFNVPLAPPKTDSTIVGEAGKVLLVGAAARYVIYYGVDIEKKRPRKDNEDVRSYPLAIERLTEADADRVIECTTPGEDACRFPKMCHCAPAGGCCCY